MTKTVDLYVMIRDITINFMLVFLVPDQFLGDIKVSDSVHLSFRMNCSLKPIANTRARMALSNVTFIRFLVFLLTFSLLCSSSASQATQPSASEPRSGGGPESGQMYVVAPTLQDCPNDTQCETLSYYAGKYTSKLANVV